MFKAHCERLELQYKKGLPLYVAAPPARPICSPLIEDEQVWHDALSFLFFRLCEVGQRVQTKPNKHGAYRPDMYRDGSCGARVKYEKLR